MDRSASEQTHLSADADGTAAQRQRRGATVSERMEGSDRVGIAAPLACVRVSACVCVSSVLVFAC